jgi:hypothetical protein
MHNEHHHYGGARMSRRIIATMTLAAVMTIALGSAAPASTAPSTDLSAEVCTMETGNAPTSSPDLDWNAGGLSGSHSPSESEEPKDANSPRRTPKDAESPTGRGRKDHLC